MMNSNKPTEAAAIQRRNDPECALSETPATPDTTLSVTPPDVLPAAVSPNEISSLARRLGQAHLKVVRDHARLYGTSLAEADSTVSTTSPEYQNYLMQKLPSDVSWADIDALMHADPNKGIERLITIRQAALAELRSGVRSSDSLAPNGTPWTQAQFLAVFDELADWHPANGVERTLLQQSALMHCQLLTWMQILAERTMTECAEGAKGGRWTAPRVSEAEAIEQAANMVDRFERMFLRCVRSLADMRRKNLVFQNSGQINIGQRQVVVAHDDATHGDAAHERVHKLPV